MIASLFFGEGLGLLQNFGKNRSLFLKCLCMALFFIFNVILAYFVNVLLDIAITAIKHLFVIQY